MLVVTRTPLRVSFFGGGTDIADYYTDHGGAVLTSTIDKYVHVMVRPRWDGLFVVRHGQAQVAEKVDDITHDLTRGCLRLAGTSNGVDIVSVSDVSAEGCGLGSSSAYTVGLLAALLRLAGERAGPKRLAELACRVEIEMLSEPIGKQDQYATAFGGFNEFRFERDGSVTVRPIALTAAQRDSLNAHVALFFTGRTRRASAELRRWQPRDRVNVSRLNTIKEGVVAGRRGLRAGDMRELGRVLDLSWHHKRQLGGDMAETPADRMHRRGKNAGAYGGKLLGAGGGGYFLFLRPPSRRDEMCEALGEHQPMPITFVDHGCTVLQSPA